jgi:hypothetical protein
MLNIFKSKAEKERILNEKINSLNAKYSDIIGCVCKINEFVFRFNGFQNIDNSICVLFIKFDTEEFYSSYLKYNTWKMIYDSSDFRKMRYNWLSYKTNLEKLDIIIKENN